MNIKKDLKKISFNSNIFHENVILFRIHKFLLFLFLQYSQIVQRMCQSSQVVISLVLDIYDWPYICSIELFCALELFQYHRDIDFPALYSWSNKLHVVTLVVTLFLTYATKVVL